MKRFLNLGCGPIHIPNIPHQVEWINIDIDPSHEPDICEDYLRLGILFRPDTIDGILSVHSVEHLPWPDGVEKFFRVTMRALQPGGVLRLVVPDLMKVAKLYVEGSDLKQIYDGPFYIGPDCAATRFMYFARAWEHTVLFDERLLTLLMLEAGYINIRRMPFGVSDTPELCGNDRFESESISIEGTKL